MEKKRFEPVFLRGPLQRDIFEKTASEQGLWVCGIDEAGRGPSAGPVVAAAAIVSLKRGGRKLLQDSKMLTTDQRQEAYRWLLEHSWFGVGVVSPRCIDQLGIIQANILAMHRAFSQLCARHIIRPAIILVDAVILDLPTTFLAPQPTNSVPNDQKPQMSTIFDDPWHKIISFNHSEKYSYSIAAASIIAKVTRDRIMQDLGSSFPRYDFEVHKGYNTPRHRELIATHGATLMHRLSFLQAEFRPPADQPLSIFEHTTTRSQLR